MIYKTRVKQYTSMPYFEAGTERFVRDWRETVVRVQVRDARYVFFCFPICDLSMFNSLDNAG